MTAVADTTEIDRITRLIPGGYDPWATAGDGDWFDYDAATSSVEFFERYLTHQRNELAGQPIMLEDWQKAIVYNLFGWKRADQTRRYRESFVFVARGNGKSTLVVGLGGLLLYVDGEPGAEVYAVAAERGQAGRLLEDLKGMVRANEELSELSRIFQHRVTFPGNRSFFAAVSSEARSKHGFDAHGVLIDELHAIPDREIVDVMTTSRRSRRQPLAVYITTAGYDKNSICFEKYEYACRVRDGIVDDRAFLPVIYELPKDADWRDEAAWMQPNPNLGVSLKMDYMREQAAAAEATPAYENVFRRLHLNQWCVALSTLLRMYDGELKRADELVVGDKIESFDEATETLQVSAVKAITTMPVGPVVTIGTKRGRVTTVSEHHKFWCRTGRPDARAFEWKEACELRVGDRVAIALGHTDIVKSGPKMGYLDARFLGVMAGDGTCKGTPRLTSVDPEVIESWKEWVEGRGDKMRPLPDGVHFDARHPTDAPSRKRTATRRFIQSCGMWGKTCYDKAVPERVFSGGEHAWRGFLAGYLDTDGHVSEDAVIFVSRSRGLLSGCQHLLSYLDIQSVLSVDKLDRWRLQVSDAISLDNFANKITPLVARKYAVLQQLRDRPRRTGNAAEDRRGFDVVTDIVVEDDRPTLGITVERTHTHITDGFITHNTEQAERVLPMHRWDECAEPFDEEELEGRSCYAGLDMSSTTDLSALALVFPPEEEGGQYHCLFRCWVPEEHPRCRARHEMASYREWIKGGFMLTTPGDIVDYERVRREIHDLRDRFDIRGIAIDRWATTHLQTLLMDDGFEVMKFTQGYAAFNAPTKALIEFVLQCRIAHGGHPVARWCASNLAADTNAEESMKPTKKKSSDRIDLMVALIMALDQAMLDDESGDDCLIWLDES